MEWATPPPAVWRHVMKRHPSLKVMRREIRACVQEGEDLRRVGNAAASAALLRYSARVDEDPRTIGAFSLQVRKPHTCNCQ